MSGKYMDQEGPEMNPEEGEAHSSRMRDNAEPPLGAPADLDWDEFHSSRRHGLPIRLLTFTTVLALAAGVLYFVYFQPDAEPEFTSLYVDSQPVVAVIQITEGEASAPGREIPYTPGMLLPEGQYQIRATAAGYEPATLGMHLRGRMVRLVITLRPES